MTYDPFIHTAVRPLRKPTGASALATQHTNEEDETDIMHGHKVNGANLVTFILPYHGQLGNKRAW